MGLKCATNSGTRSVPLAAILRHGRLHELLGSERGHSRASGQCGDQSPNSGRQGAAGVAARSEMFAEHIADQQLANELPIQLRIEAFIPRVEHRLKHILKAHDSVVKEAVKEAERKIWRNDKQLSRLCMFQVRLEMLDECIEPLVWVRKRERRLNQAAMKALSFVPDERIEQLILRGKVAVKGAPRYAGSFAYSENGHTMYARS
jgi:hypothetical protein